MAIHLNGNGRVDDAMKMVEMHQLADAQRRAQIEGLHLSIAGQAFAGLVAATVSRALDNIGPDGQFRVDFEQPYNIANAAADQFMVRKGLMRQVPAVNGSE